MMSAADAIKPALAAGVRMHTDKLTGQRVLLAPETVFELKGPGAAIVSLCNGQRTADEIAKTLSERYRAPVERVAADVHRYIERLEESLLLEVASASHGLEARVTRSASCDMGFQPMRTDSQSQSPSPTNRPPRPVGLIAELTYRCPLHCPYCSNPTTFQSDNELATTDWARVFKEASDLGIYHALLSGGEPLARTDLDSLIESARTSGLYTNLITSAVGLTPQRAQSLKSAGLDSVQISFQSDQPELADPIALTSSHHRKLQAASLVKEMAWPLTVNVVIHRRNIDRLESIIAMAEELGARRLELANVQFYGWAFRNRQQLLPSRDQIDRATQIAQDAQHRLAGRMQILFVLPDYFATRPKPCMNGWGRRYIAVNPVGDCLPCPTAYEIPGLKFENVRHRDLKSIWQESDSFNRFRGTTWMPEPCRSCDLREVDFGGCRCQAALLTGDPSNTDPACELSPHRKSLSQFVGASHASEKSFAYRLL